MMQYGIWQVFHINESSLPGHSVDGRRSHVKSLTRFLFLSIVGCALAVSPCLAQSDSQGQKPPITISPSRGVLGQQYTVTLTAVNCADPKLSSFALPTPKGSGLTVTKEADSADGCTKRVDVSVAADAPVGTVKLNLENRTDATKIKPAGEFELVASPPGPIPPGLTPQVDVQWKVLDPDVVEDNFGHHVRELYYCIQLTIGNNSGYDLQIASVGFVPAGKGTGQPTVDTDYALVRGSLDWGQRTNFFNLVSLTLQGAGGVFTAALPLVANSTKRAQRAEVVNLLSPVATLMTFIYPFHDSFTSQFKQLDDNTLREGFLVHNNDHHKPVLVFLAKKDLMPGARKSCEIEPHYWGIRHNSENPSCIKEQLSKLVLVGDLVEYINRVSIIKPSSTAAGPLLSLSPESVTFRDTPVDSSKNQTITLTNTGNANLTISKIDHAPLSPAFITG